MAILVSKLGKFFEGDDIIKPDFEVGNVVKVKMKLKGEGTQKNNITIVDLMIPEKALLKIKRIDEEWQSYYFIMSNEEKVFAIDFTVAHEIWVKATKDERFVFNISGTKGLIEE